MGHFDFLVQVEQTDKNGYHTPSTYKLGFRECWAHLAKRVCDDQGITTGYARLTHVFWDERCLLPGDENHLSNGTLVVPSDNWGQPAIPHSAMPGIVLSVNKAGRSCQVKWRNTKLSKKLKMPSSTESNVKNMQLHKYQPLALKLDMSPWDYGVWEYRATISLDLQTNGGEGYTKVSAIQNYFAKPAYIPPSFREMLIGYDGDFSADEPSEDEKTPTFVGKAVPVPKTRPKRPSEGRVNKADVGPNPKTARLSSPKRFPKAVAPATNSSPTPASASAALATNGSRGSGKVEPSWSPSVLAAWMEKHGGNLLKQAAKIVIDQEIWGKMLLEWLSRTEDGTPASIAARKEIPFTSVTFRAIRETVREYDDTIQPSPTWPCGCSAHLSSMYQADDEPVIHLGAYDKKKVGEKCKIGRHGNADYQLSFRDRTREIYMTISRVHTEIILTEMGWVAKDNSENGTFVNQLLLNQDEGHLLKHGDVLSLGTAPSKIKGYVFYFFDLGG